MFTVVVTHRAVPRGTERSLRARGAVRSPRFPPSEVLMSVKFRNALLAVAATVVSLTAGCTDAGTPVSPRASAPDAAFSRGATTTPTTSETFAAPGDAVAQLALFKVKPQVT